MAETHDMKNQNLADSIDMLEQILEVMPQDTDALKALYTAYQQVGQDVKAFDYLSRMVEVYSSSSDPSLLPFIREQLAAYESTFPSEVAAHSARIRLLSGEADEALPAEVPVEQKKNAVNTDADISEELALAWRLYEENQLSQEEYSSVLHDLTEVSSRDLDVPVSVLHVLNDRGFTQMNRIMNYLSSRSGAPCISLSQFELSEDVAVTIPLDIAAHDGALPFSFMGEDLLVAVLNPFNNKLVDKVEKQIGLRCHTYLVEPEDYDLALGKIRGLANKVTASAQA